MVVLVFWFLRLSVGVGKTICFLVQALSTMKCAEYTILFFPFKYEEQDKIILMMKYYYRNLKPRYNCYNPSLLIFAINWDDWIIPEP